MAAVTLTTTKLHRSIGERLREERERLGYSAGQIAQLLGLTAEAYAGREAGASDTGLFSMPRLHDCGFDIMYIITGERHRPVQEESELLKRFRELSRRGRNTVFLTLDALERLAPNLKSRLRTVAASK